MSDRIFTKRFVSKKNTYDSWEYAYFPYLIDMYKLIYKEHRIDIIGFYEFCQFIYSVSSGKIISYLEEVDNDLYYEYLSKRSQIF